MVDDETAWLDEIDFDPGRSHLVMGTRQLGDRPWLLVDHKRGEELALKAELLASVHDEVFVALDGTAEAGAEVLELIGSGIGGSVAHSCGHPLCDAGQRIQEDLCLLRREETGWILVAGTVCFPSRWRLGDKMGLSLDAVHGPVAGYADALAGRVNRMFDRLDNRIAWRRNWFIHPNPALYQPQRSPGGDAVIAAADCLDQLHLRSERQTVRRLPATGFVLFTIRTQQEPLSAVVASPERRTALDGFVAEGDPAVVAHKGIGDTQRGELLAALAHRGP